MPRLMKTTRVVLALVAGLAMLLAACTGGDDGGNGGNGDPTGPTGQTGQTGGGPTPVQSGSATAGTYEYENAGLHVVLDIEGTAGTMQVDNGTDRELPRPDFYIIWGDSRDQVEGEVTNAAPIPAGETSTFDISFEGIQVGEIGAIALLFGQDNFGLFVRTG